MEQNVTRGNVSASELLNELSQIDFGVFIFKRFVNRKVSLFN